MNIRLSLQMMGAFFISFAFAVGLFLLMNHTSKAEGEITWGVDYSASQAAYLGLDPMETYSAIIQDLGAKHIKIHINWDAIEKEKGTYDFSQLDAQVKEAESNNVKLILVVGMKTGRWPECHAPVWFESLPQDQRNEALLLYIQTVVERYKNSKAIAFWQVENEPMIHFGICPTWYYNDKTAPLQAEVDRVKFTDPSHKIIVSDSGELSSWMGVARVGDIVGITTYRSSWSANQKTFGVNAYAFLTPEFYAAKAALIQNLFGKQVISIELQAEPWASKPLAEASLEEQEKSMNPALFAENIDFAKQTGLSTFYFWGAEWWYYMKTEQNKPEIWNSARELFTQ